MTKIHSYCSTKSMLVFYVHCLKTLISEQFKKVEQKKNKFKIIKHLENLLFKQDTIEAFSFASK